MLKGEEEAEQTRLTGEQITNPATSYHPVIGIVVFILLLIQPVLGVWHHRNFRIFKRRTLSSHLHLWDGRIIIILGIVNGGLGLHIAHAEDTAKLAYTIVAAIFGGTWVVLAVLRECKGDKGRNILAKRTTKNREAAAKMGRLQGAGTGRGSDDRSVGSSTYQGHERASRQ